MTSVPPSLSPSPPPDSGSAVDGDVVSSGVVSSGVVSSPISAAAARGLAGYDALVSFPVQWGEMDSYQHVNNVVYFRWFESARMKYFEGIGFTSNTGVGPILSSTSCRYKAPLFYPDRVTAGCRVSDIKEDRFTMEIALFSDAAGRVAATGEALIVAYDYAAKQKAPLPPAVRAHLTSRR